MPFPLIEDMVTCQWADEFLIILKLFVFVVGIAIIYEQPQWHDL